VNVERTDNAFLQLLHLGALAERLAPHLADHLAPLPDPMAGSTHAAPPPISASRVTRCTA